MVYFAPLEGLFRDHPDLIGLAEIEPQTMWMRATEPRALPRGNPSRLVELAELPQRKLLHGVGSPIGGTLGERNYNPDEFRHWARRLGSPWTSEHLSVLDVLDNDGVPRSCGFLMPPPQTDAQVTLAAANIRRRQAATGLPFAFETGVNYFAPRPGEMADGAFFAAVADAADCGILLDITNLWVNGRNGRASVAEVMRHLPRERVWEVHLSGPDFGHGAWLDAHAGGIDREIAALAAEIVAELPNLGAIVFELAADRIGAFGDAAVLREMETLHRLWERAGSAMAPAVPRERGGGRGLRPAAWEQEIAARMLPAHLRPPSTAALPAADAGVFALYLRLVASFRRGAIAELLENSVRLLLLGLGEAGTAALLDAYVAAEPPRLFPSDEALAFAEFVAEREVSLPGFADVLAFEAALIRAVADSRAVRVTLRRDLDTVLGAIRAGHLPTADEVSPYVLEIGGGSGGSLRALA